MTTTYEEFIKAHADPAHELCGGTGIVIGATHQVIPDQPGAAWWKDEDRVCDCVSIAHE